MIEDLNIGKCRGEIGHEARARKSLSRGGPREFNGIEDRSRKNRNAH
jgi:hypothetical protein